MSASPVARPERPVLAAKWVFPFLPWLSVGVAALKHPAYWPSFEGRVIHVIGCAAFTAGLLAVIQPWRRDDDRSA